MDKNKLDWIISIVKSLREEATSAPTMNLGAGQIAGTREAGDDPPVFRKRKNYAKGGSGSRKMWLGYLKK
jgi:hypothetical protein